MKKLTILIGTIDCVGHVNALIGTTQPLVKRGHRVIFMAAESYRGKLAPLGYEEHIFTSNDSAPSKSSSTWADDLVSLKCMGPFPLEEKYRRIIEVFSVGPNALKARRQADHNAREAIEKYKPDLLIVDAYCTPSIYYSGIPWVNNVSITALAHCSNDSDELPPSSSGFPTDSPRDEAWHRFKKLNLLYKFSAKINDFYEKELGYRRYPNDRMLPYEDALLSLYAYPEEYNYPAMRRKDWFNIEVFNKNVTHESISLAELLPLTFFTDTLDGKWSGKWVYLSMGSMGSIDLDLMKRLSNAISLSRHKFIVSKGPRHSEFDLPRNAWGDRYLPQTKIVPLMDLVITHGGNNTTTETFAQGIPMLLMPLFGDQYDNAQRLHETGYGHRLDPYEFTTDQLVQVIDQLLADIELKERCKQASKRILSEDRHEQLADLIEQRWCEKMNVENLS